MLLWTPYVSLPPLYASLDSGNREYDYEYSMSATPPLLNNADGKIAKAAVKDEQSILALTIEALLPLGDDSLSEYVILLEIRNKDGITISLQSRSDSSFDFPNPIEFMWTPSEKGDFQARAFVISSLQNLQILSSITTSDIIVVGSAIDLLTIPDVVAESDDIIDVTIENNTQNSDSDGMAEYTIMVYMVASDLETNGYYATDDILEMMSVGSTENVNLIVQTGGSANANIDEIRFIDFTKVQRHLILRDKIDTVEDLGQHNMATASSLSDFLKFGVTNYPAKKYVAIMWDHGAGIIGFGYDNIYGDILTPDELAQAFAAGMKASGAKFDIIGFDACLMATVEIANKLSSYGKYLVASQEIEPAWGWDYSAIMSSLNGSESPEPLMLSKTIVDSYVEHTRKNVELYDDYGSDKSITMSVIDLSKIPELVSDLQYLDERFYMSIYDLDESYSFAKVIRATERYGETGKASTGHLDLFHFAENIDLHLPQLQGSAGSAIIKAGVTDVVVYNVKGESKPNSNGISMFMQVEEYEANAPYLGYLIGSWPGVFDRARLLLQEDITPPSVILSKNDDDLISGRINGEDVADVLFLVTKRTQSGSGDNYLGRAEILSLEYREPSDVMDESTGYLEYNWSQEIMSLCNDGENCIPTWIYAYRNGDLNFAYIPARLESEKYDGYVTLTYLVHDNSEFEFLGAWPGVDEHGNAAREFLPLIEGAQLHTFTTEIDYDDFDYYREIEHGPITVGEQFGPEYHHYSGRYYLAVVGCDFSDNCGGSQYFRFDVD